MNFRESNNSKPKVQRVPLIHSASPQSFTTVPQSVRKLVRKLSQVGQKKHSLAVWSSGMILGSVFPPVLGGWSQATAKSSTPERGLSTRKGRLSWELYPGPRTLTENHTTRPNSEMMLDKIALFICARINFLILDSNFLADPFGVCFFGPYQKGLVMEDWAPVAVDISYFTGLISAIDVPMV